jgi:hypothetical protein
MPFSSKYSKFMGKSIKKSALFEKYVIDRFSGVIHRGVGRGEILAPARDGVGNSHIPF